MGRLFVSGRSVATIGTASPPPAADRLPDIPAASAGWGAFFASPFVLILVNKWWEERQQRNKVDVKREESQVDVFAKMMAAFAENEGKLLEQMQNQHKTLLDDVINRHDEALKNMQASLAMQAQVSSTMAENLRVYAEMAIKRSEETARLLSSLETMTSRTLIESFNSQIRVTQDVAKQLSVLNQHNQQEIKLLEQLHLRFDKHHGANLDSYDLRQQQG